MRATASSQITDPSLYLYEIKYDGYRLLVARAGPEVRLVSRKGNDWTARFSPIAEAISQLRVREAVLDGEACIVDPLGRPSFQMLQGWLAGEKVDGKIAFVVFDLLWLDGRDLRNYVFAPESGIFETLVDLGDPVAAGQTVGRIHSLEHPEREPAPIVAALDGITACIRAISWTEQGDNVLVFGQPIAASALL